MISKKNFQCLALTILGALATVRALSCTPQQLNAVLVGVNAIADAVNQQEEDVSFFDWLEQELDD
jgi:hypothetical protein